jgi:hypothetical protein
MIALVLCGQERADIPSEDEVGLPGALDRLSHLRIGAMHKGPNLAADVLLPLR